VGAVAAEEVAVLEPVEGTVVVTVMVTVVAMVAVMVVAMVVAMVMVSPLAIAMAGPASRSATAVGQRSLHPAASIARVRQPDDCPPRHPDGRIRQVG